MQPEPKQVDGPLKIATFPTDFKQDPESHNSESPKTSKIESKINQHTENQEKPSTHIGKDNQQTPMP